MRGVVPRRLNMVLPLAASITNAPDCEPPPRIALRSWLFRVEAGEAAAVPSTGETSAANTAIAMRRGPIGGVQQGRGGRGSLLIPPAVSPGRGGNCRPARGRGS